MSNSGAAIRPAHTRFGTFAFWVTCLNTHVLQDNWYVAGGLAAWLRIEQYLNKDPNYYNPVRQSIFPGDIEIGVLAERAVVLRERYGEMLVSIEGQVLKVDIQPQDAGTLQTHRARCGALSNALVYTAPELVRAYTFASNPLKAEKRKLRVAMLKLIQSNQRIDQAGVQRQSGGLSFTQELAGFKLKPPGAKLK